MATVRAPGFGGLLEAARLQQVQVELLDRLRRQNFLDSQGFLQRLSQGLQQGIEQKKAERRQKSAKSKQRKKSNLTAGLSLGGAALGGFAGFGALGGSGILGGGAPGLFAGSQVGAGVGGGLGNLINTGDPSGFANAFGQGSALVQQNRFLEIIKDMRNRSALGFRGTDLGGNPEQGFPIIQSPLAGIGF